MTRSVVDPGQFAIAGDAPTVRRETGPEDESHVTERVVVTDRARFGGRYRRRVTDAQQLALGIADIGTIQVTCLERAQRPPAVESIVDRAGTLTGAPLTSGLEKLHPTRLPMTTPDVPTARVQRDCTPTRKSGAVATDPNPPPTTRRHPSAGNVGMPIPEAGDAQPAAGHQGTTLDYPAGYDRDVANLQLGPGLDPDLVGRLIGHLKGRRILELGCGDGANSVAMALAGAKVISVDTSAERLGDARRLAEEHEVRVEFHHADLADLAFIRADQVDLALAIYSLTETEDVARVFRQVDRVLRTDASFIVALPHPVEWATSERDGAVVFSRSMFDTTPVDTGRGTPRFPHSISEVFVALSRSNFRVDHLMEPPIDPGTDPDPLRHEMHPATVLFRGRKQGS